MKELLATLVLIGWTVGCASTPRRGRPAGQDFLYPRGALGELNPEEGRQIRAGWDKLLAGQPHSAQKIFLKLLEQHPRLVPARTGLAYAALWARRPVQARDEFARVLAMRSDYVPALVGAGGAALALLEHEEALEYYRRALEFEPEHAGIRRRLSEIKLRVTETRVAAGRTALGSGDVAAAVEEYRAALHAAPEVGGLRVALAELLAQQGDLEGAAKVLLADPAGHRQVLVRLGGIREQQGDLRGALAAYQHLLAREPADVEARRLALSTRKALELREMPPEYRRIFGAERITRADLAALVDAKVTALGRFTPGDSQVAVDISGSWARDAITRLLALGVLDVYPNHTFQPAGVVRRGELARAVARTLDLLRWPSGDAPVFTDMSARNLFHEAGRRVVAAGLMDLTPSGAFEPWRPVSGQTAAAVIEALVDIVGP